MDDGETFRTARRASAARRIQAAWRLYIKEVVLLVHCRGCNRIYDGYAQCCMEMDHVLYKTRFYDA